MKRSSVLISSALLCSILLITATYWFVTRDNTSQTQENSTAHTRIAPEFHLPDASGNIVSLGSVESDVIIVNFWASWSPYSADELQMLNRIQREYGGAVSVLALNRDTYPEDGKRFLVDKKVEDNITFVYDRDDAYYKKVKGFAVPETLFINSEGEIVSHVHGPVTYDDVHAQIEKMQQ